MTREPVLIRVDGARASGWEAVARCHLIANALQRRRRTCHFLAQLEPNGQALALNKSGHEWLEADAPAGAAEDLEEITREVRRLRPAAVFVDGPGVGPDYLAELIELGPLVVSVDTTAQFRIPSQLVLNPDLNVNVADFEVCPGTQILSGRRYALVRPEIRRVRPLRAQEPPEPWRVLVALGDDPNNQTLRVARLLLSQKKIGFIDLIVRGQHASLPEWQALAEEHRDRVSLSTEAGEAALKVSRCHLAVADGTAWALEFACVGVPMVLLAQRDETWATALKLEEENVAQCLGRFDDIEDEAIVRGVMNLLEDPLERQVMARCGRALIDGRGPDRLVTALEVMLHPSRQIDLHEAA
jgi:spore coat polysaccharide biosynthesis predicted glycosyltransferase SpsG